jgi:hypothetical protein
MEMQKVKVVGGNINTVKWNSRIFSFPEQQSLLCYDVLLCPAGQAAVALDRESVSAVAAAEAADAGAQAAKGALLARLAGLHGVVEGALGEGWQTDGARVLGAGVQVGGREEAADGGGAGAVAAGGAVD